MKIFSQFFIVMLCLSLGITACNNVNDEEIKKIFNSSEVKISWITNNDENQEKQYNLRDIIEFK